MDPEDLQSDLLAFRRLYGLLVKDEHYVEDAGSENLDNNTRRLLISLLYPAANKAFDAHAKILGTQFRPTNSSWSTPQGQPRDIQSLKSFSVRNAPSPQTVDLLTGEGTLNEPMSQVDLAGEPGLRMKRCRVCRKPKVKQLTKEISFRDTNSLTTISRLQNQNHKRRWEVENEPITINGPFFTILTDQEDHISREASTKILQLESCISSLQVAVKNASFLKSESVNEDKTFDPNSSTSQRIWKPRDTGQQWCDQSLVNTMLPSSQIISQLVEEPVVKRTETFNPIQNQFDDTPDEAYYLFHKGENSSNIIKPAGKNLFLQMAETEAPVNTMLPSSQITSQQVVEPVRDKIEMLNPIKNEYDNIPDEAYFPLQSGGNSSNVKKPADKNRILQRNKSSQTNRQQLSQLQTVKTEALANTMLPSSRITSQQVEEPVADKTEIFNPRKKQYDHTPDEAHYLFDKDGNSSVVKKPADKNRVLHRNTSSQINRQQLDPSQMAKTEAQVNKMLPSSQVTSKRVEEPVVEKTKMFSPRQNQYDNIPDVKKLADKNRVLRRNVSSQTNRQQLDQLQIAKTGAVSSSEITEWRDPSVGYGKPSNEQQKAKPSKAYTDQTDYYRGKHVVVDPKRLTSVATQRLPENPVSSSNYSTQVQSPSPGPSRSPSYRSLNDSEGSLHDHREVNSESSGSEAHEKSETELALVLSQYQSPNKGGSFESSGSMPRRTVPEKGHERDDPKDKLTTVSSRDQSPYRNSSSNESLCSNATEMIPKRGHKSSNPKEPKRKDESKNNTVSSRSHESSGSGSGRMVPIKGLQKSNKKELKTKSESSSSNEVSGSGSERMDPKKGKQKEPERSESASSNEFSGSGSRSGSESGSGPGSGSGSLSGSGSGPGSGSGSGSGSDSRSGSGSRSRSGSGSGSYSGSGSGSRSVSWSGSGSGSGSGKEKESDMNTVSSEDQDSSANESSGSSSSKTDQKEPEKNQGWRLGKLKDKLAVIFHHHHHHHHHHGDNKDDHDDDNDNDNDDDDDDEGSHKDNYKKAWKQTKKIIGHSSKTSAHAAKIIGKETKKILGQGSKTGAKAAVIIGKETTKIIGQGSKTGAKAAKIIGKETTKIIGQGTKTGAKAAKILGKETKKIIGQGSKTGAKAAKILGKQALVYEAHAEHAVKKMASTAVKKALEAKKDKHHGSHAAKKSVSRGLEISQAHGEHAVKKDEVHGEHTIKKDAAHGEHAVHDSKALVVVNDHEAHGSHEIKDESKALVLVNDGGHSDHSVKKNENLALVLVNDGGHGSHSVKNESKALVVHKPTSKTKTDSKALVVHKPVVKIDSKALVVHKSVGKKPTGVQSLMGGLLKQSKDSTKSSKSKSATKGTSGASSSGKKQGGGGGSSSGGKLKTSMVCLQMLRQKRRLERMEKLRRKIATDKKH